MSLEIIWHSLDSVHSKQRDTKVCHYFYPVIIFQSIIFGECNINSLVQLNALASLRRLENLTISKEGNPITGFVLWKHYLLFRMAHLNIKKINGEPVRMWLLRFAHIRWQYKWAYIIQSRGCDISKKPMDVYFLDKLCIIPCCVAGLLHPTKVLGKSVGLCKSTKRKDKLYISLLLVSVWRIICENFNPNGLVLAEIWRKI